MGWTDSHCHIPFETGDGRSTSAEAITEARSAGVDRLITIGTDADHSWAAISLARDHEGVWATVGLHPHEAIQGVDTIVAFVTDPTVVAIGECGLDYHYDHSPRDAQRDAFAAQIALAHEHDLALVIHTRQAWDDTWAILVEGGVPKRTVVHCFSGGPQEARRALDLGAFLSFSGIVSFKGAADVREAAGLCPADRLLVETDAPFLAPVPHRGRPNRPAWVTVVGAAVAAARGVLVADIEAQTSANASLVFGLT